MEKKYEKEEAQQLAEKKLNEFCKKLTQKGVQIIENNVMIVTEENQCSASGMLTVIEPIGSKQDTILSDAPNENGKGL
ncbi:MAG: sporulation protein YqfD [Lachnospiraceae bacterium]